MATRKRNITAPSPKETGTAPGGSQSPSQPLDPFVEPNYSTHADLVGGRRLVQQLQLKRKEIAEAARVHQNTATAIVGGQKAQYRNVHAVFTVLNVAMSNGLKRSDYVRCIEGRTGKAFVDDGLNKCSVFPNIGKYIDEVSSELQGIGSPEKQIGDLARVRTRFIMHMMNGLPVARNLVEATFEVLNKLKGGSLQMDAELFN